MDKNTDLTVSVVIPSFNGLTLLQKYLPSVIRAISNPANKIKEVIVVDDGSGDGSAEYLKNSYPEIKLFKFTRNRGFAASVNMGVRMAKGNLVVLLNNDVRVSENFLVNVFDHFRNKKVFAVSFHEQGFAWARGVFNNGFIGHDPGIVSDTAHISFWANGGSAIYRRELWVELGGMDERLFAPFYWEDIDLSYRAQKRGYLIIWEPKSRVEHSHESTISKIPLKFTERIRQRNQLLFIWKDLTSKNLSKKHISGLVERVFKHPGYILIIFMALIKLGLVFKRHRQEIKESKISDEAIFDKFS